MKNEIDLNKNTKDEEQFIKCKTCGNYFPTNMFIVNKNSCKSRSCKFCRAQKQMKSKILKD